MSDDIGGVEIIDEAEPATETAKPQKGQPVSHTDLEALVSKQRRQIEATTAEAQRAREEAQRARREAEEAGRRVETAEETRYNTEVQAVASQLSATEAELDRAEGAYAAAMEAGDHRAVAHAQRAMTAASVRITGLEARKEWLTNNKDEILAASRPKQQPEMVDDPLARRLGRQPSAGERAWARDNPEFATNDEFYNAVVQYHHEAMRKRLAPDTADYYAYIDKRVAEDYRGEPQQEVEEVQETPQRPAIQRPAAQMPVQRRVGPGGPSGGNGVIRLTADEKEAADISLAHLPVQDYQENGVMMPGRYKTYAMGRDRAKQRGQL